MDYTYEENLRLGREIVPQTKLIEWIEEQLRQRDWKPADLARAASVRDSTISRVLNGNAKAGPELCNAMASALDVNPVEVFRIAELLPPSVGTIDELTPEEAELIQIRRKLARHRQIAMLETARAILDRYGGE
jgi:transcriptional regulator with XRE-family HTH domain